MLVQYRDPSLSLWQSAIDETIRGDTQTWTPRPSLASLDTPGSILREVARYCAAVTGELPLGHLLSSEPAFTKLLALPAATTVHEQLSYCSSLFLQLAKATASGDAGELAKLQSEVQFGDCDPHYVEAVTKYVEYFKLRRQPIRYIAPTGRPNDSVEQINEQCKIALVGDWGTGQQPAKTVLERIRKHNPDIVIHLGDIYYSGTRYEAANYFLNVFKDVFQTNNFARDVKPRVFTMAGNHDMYAGGDGYYWLLKQIGQCASYFCLQNNHWRFAAVDTGYNDHDPLTVSSTATRLQDLELKWLQAQVGNAGGARTVLISHHPLFSAFDDIAGKPFNDQLLQQVRDLLPHITAWFWAHEHNLVIYKEYLNIHARLVGHGAFPVGIKELSLPKHPIPFYEGIVLGNDGICFNHGYALITLDGEQGRADYYECGAAADTLNHSERLNDLP